MIGTKWFGAAVLLSVGFSLAANAVAESAISSSAFRDDHLYLTSINAGEMLTPAISSTSASEAALPEAPDTLLAPSAADSFAGQDRPAKVAPKYTMYIPAGWQAQPITQREKVILGLRDSVSPFSLLGTVFSAGYSHVTNGEPNYGTNSEAFGKRLGATAVRDISDSILAESVFAPVFHEDPRYYVMGSGHNFIKRVLYAGTRTIITRSDSGNETLNASLLVGYAAGSAISYTYYPKINQNFHDTANTFGGSLAGAAIGNIVSEFSDQVLIKLHLKKAQ